MRHRTQHGQNLLETALVLPLLLLIIDIGRAFDTFGEPPRVAVAYPHQTFMNGVPLFRGGSFGLGTLTLRAATDMAIYTQRLVARADCGRLHAARG
jgi:hypothetical protein